MVKRNPYTPVKALEVQILLFEQKEKLCQMLIKRQVEC